MSVISPGCRPMFFSYRDDVAGGVTSCDTISPMHDSSAPPPALGIRHVALKVKDLEAQEKFYTRVLGYEVEWRPDADNVYLTLGNADNLALHREKTLVPKVGPLDHFGIM